MTFTFLQTSNQGKKWPIYEWMSVGSIIIAGFALATYAGVVPWVLATLMTSVTGIEMATIRAISLRPKSETLSANLDPAMVHVADVQVNPIVGKPVITGVDIMKLSPMVLEIEKSMPKMALVRDPISMANTTDGVYISSFDAVRAQCPNKDMNKGIKVIDHKENHSVKKKEKGRKAKKKEKTKPRVKLIKRKIVHLNLSAVRDDSPLVSLRRKP